MTTDAFHLSLNEFLSDTTDTSLPESWERIRLGHILEEIKDTVPAETVEQLTPSVVHGVVPQSELEQKPQQALREDYELLPAQPGDFVVTMSSYEYGIEYCEISGGISPDYTVLRPTVSEAQVEFLRYLFKSTPFIQLISLLSSGIRQGKRIYWSELQDVVICIPDPSTASTIVSYLNYQTSNIEELVQKKENFLNLLEEKWISLISQVVTRGLDPNIQTKITHLDWLGVIPNHWEIRRLKFCCDRIVDAINRTAPTTEEGYGYMVRTTQIRDGQLDLEDADMVDKEIFHEWNRREVPQGGDLIFTREAPVGEACIIPENSNITLGQRMMLVRPDDEILNNRYLLYWFYSKMAKYQYSINSHGSTVEHLRVETIPNLEITLPPRSEQDKIVEYLKQERNHIQELKEIVERAIPLLQETRQSVITKAVTGQTDVTDWKISKKEVTTL